MDDTNAFVLVGLGDVCRKLRYFQRAVEYYGRILEIDPRNVFALRGMGNAYRACRRRKNPSRTGSAI